MFAVGIALVSQITEYSKLKGTHKDHQVQLLSEWAIHRFYQQQWCYEHHAQTN